MMAISEDGLGFIDMMVEKTITTMARSGISLEVGKLPTAREFRVSFGTRTIIISLDRLYHMSQNELSKELIEYFVKGEITETPEIKSGVDEFVDRWLKS